MEQQRPFWGGWQVNGVNIFQTGLPFTPTLGAATVNTGTGSRPDRVGDGTLADPTVDRRFDVTAFHDAAAVHLRQARAQHSLRSRPHQLRTFQFSSSSRFRTDSVWQFRAEVFNVFNTAQFDLPNATIGTGAAGTITGIVGTPRQIQFGLKAIF